MNSGRRRLRLDKRRRRINWCGGSHDSYLAAVVRMMLTVDDEQDAAKDSIRNKKKPGSETAARSSGSDSKSKGKRKSVSFA